jgi:hypothetical protein
VEFASLYYRVMHDETGHPRARHQSAAYGVAAALLIELIIAGQIKVWAEGITLRGAPDPQERLTRHTFDTLVLHPTQKPKQWLRQLSYTAPVMTAMRLGFQQHLHMPEGEPDYRITERPPAMFIPVSPADFVQPFHQVAYVIANPGCGEPWHVTWLAGLALATGIGPALGLPEDQVHAAAAGISAVIPFEIRDLLDIAAACCAESNRNLTPVLHT